MTCDNCKRSATVHLTEIKSGIKTERHLCEECAAASAGLAPNEQVPINELLTKFVLAHTKRWPQQPPK